MGRWTAASCSTLVAGCLIRFPQLPPAATAANRAHLGSRARERVRVEGRIRIVTRDERGSEGWAWGNVRAAWYEVATASEGRSTAASRRYMSSTSTAKRLMLVCTGEVVGVEDALVVRSGCGAPRSALEEHFVLVIGVLLRLVLGYGTRLGALCCFGY
jgi:hypothetical protein